jgi:hypothetical protein
MHGAGGRGGPGKTRRQSRCRIPATVHASTGQVVDLLPARPPRRRPGRYPSEIERMRLGARSGCRTVRPGSASRSSPDRRQSLLPLLAFLRADGSPAQQGVGRADLDVGVGVLLPFGQQERLLVPSVLTVPRPAGTRPGFNPADSRLEDCRSVIRSIFVESWTWHVPTKRCAVSSAVQQRVIVSLSGPDADSRVVRTALTLAPRI